MLIQSRCHIIPDDVSFLPKSTNDQSSNVIIDFIDTALCRTQAETG